MNKNIKLIQWLYFLCVAFFSPTLCAGEINLKRGQIHLNEGNGVFATALDGDYTIVVTVDYDSRSMSAVVVDSSSGVTTCIPSPCNIK